MQTIFTWQGPVVGQPLRGVALEDGKFFIIRTNFVQAIDDDGSVTTASSSRYWVRVIPDNPLVAQARAVFESGQFA